MNTQKAPVKYRFLNWLSEKNISNKECASKTGICESILRQKEVEFSLETIKKISSFYTSLNLNWLIVGIGSPEITGQIPLESIIKYYDNAIKEIRNSHAQVIATKEKYIIKLEQENNKNNRK